MSLREEIARRAFVWGRPSVQLYGLLRELVLVPERLGGESHRNRVLPGRRALDELDELDGIDSAPSSEPGATAFCSWLDLRGGPLLVDVQDDPSTTVTLLDLHADVVGHVPDDLELSSQVSVVAGPSWEPAAPSEASTALWCTTDLCLSVGRRRPVTRSRDMEACSLRLRPTAPATAVAPLIPPPLPPPVPAVDTNRPPTTAFLLALDWMLPLMPARPQDEELHDDLRAIGVCCGPHALREALAEDRVDGHLTVGLRRGFEEASRRSVATGRRLLR